MVQLHGSQQSDLSDSLLTVCFDKYVKKVEIKYCEKNQKAMLWHWPLSSSLNICACTQHIAAILYLKMVTMGLKTFRWISVITINNSFLTSVLSEQLTDAVGAENTRTDMQLQAQQIIHQIYSNLFSEFYFVRHDKERCYRDSAGEEQLWWASPLQQHPLPTHSECNKSKWV